MNIPYVMKRCTKCGRWLVASTVNFHKRKGYKYGLYSECKECRSNQRKQSYEINKEKERERYKQWYEANRDEISKQNKLKYKSKKRDIPKYKVCSSCGDILLNTTDNFRKITKGYSSKCKKCECKASKQWYDSHKEQRAEHDKIYYQEHKERKQETSKIWYQNNREKRLEHWQEYRKSDHGKQVLAAKRFNDHNKRRLLEQNQGKGITSEQYKEVMSFFDWKCAYSGEKLKKDTRTLDHIISLKQGGDHEIWNLVPMTRSLNSSKQEKDMLEWYKEQDCYSEARLAKIYEWQEYARKKWKK